MIRSFVSILFLVLAMTLRAGDAPDTHQYVAAVGGVVCQECKAKITFAVKKLPGVKDVSFAKGEKSGEQKVSFASTSTALEKKDILQALGEAASEFQVLSVEKVK